MLYPIHLHFQYISAVVRVSKPVVPLLNREFFSEQLSVSYIVKSAKSGGAMAPLAPLLTIALAYIHARFRMKKNFYTKQNKGALRGKNTLKVLTRSFKSKILKLLVEQGFP